LYKLPIGWVYERTRKNEIPYVRFGKYIRFGRKELEACLKERSHN
jgi:hypothetical protein